VIDIDQYMILSELGRGPRGVVYKARDRLTDCLVALKSIDPLREGRAASTLETAWFVSDALSAWRLTHPNIVTVYAAGDAGGKVYVAMELLKGHSLRRELGFGSGYCVASGSLQRPPAGLHTRTSRAWCIAI
jgi:serine/threonine-protein kinase